MDKAPESIMLDTSTENISWNFKKAAREMFRLKQAFPEEGHFLLPDSNPLDNLEMIKIGLGPDPPDLTQTPVVGDPGYICQLCNNTDFLIVKCKQCALGDAPYYICALCMFQGKTCPSAHHVWVEPTGNLRRIEASTISELKGAFCYGISLPTILEFHDRVTPTLLAAAQFDPGSVPAPQPTVPTEEVAELPQLPADDARDKEFYTFDQFEHSIIKPRSTQFVTLQTEQAADRYRRNQERTQRNIAVNALNAVAFNSASAQPGEESVSQEVNTFLETQSAVYQLEDDSRTELEQDGSMLNDSYS